MSKLLVLDYGNGHTRDSGWLERVLGGSGCELQKSSSANDDDLNSQCDAVLVVDDGDTNGVAALHSALRMRRCSPELPIAVIKPISSNWTETEATAYGVSDFASANQVNARLSTNQVSEMFSGVDQRHIDMRISDGAILFEYQG